MANVCNVPSRTIFTGDNLDILRGINSECVDLIYLDPPFKSDQTYAAPLDSEARGRGVPRRLDFGRYERRVD